MKSMKLQTILSFVLKFFIFFSFLLFFGNDKLGCECETGNYKTLSPYLPVRMLLSTKLDSHSTGNGCYIFPLLSVRTWKMLEDGCVAR